VTLLARVVEQHAGEVPIAAVEGEVDASNAAEIRDRVSALLTNRSRALVVDLTRTTYLDSAGINLLFALGASLAERQQELHLVVSPSSPIARAIAITGLDATVPTHARLQDAIERLR
jgi:anti-sigma B factor antagonist